MLATTRLTLCIYRIVCLSILLVLGACSHTDPVSSAAQTSEPDAYRAFDHESMYDLLLAEFALRRGVSEQAAQLYYDQAQAQQDLQLSRHAARLAHSIEDHALAIKAANLWLRMEPTSHEALSIKAIALISSNQSLQSTYPLLEANARAKETAIFTHLALNTKTAHQQWQLLNYFQSLLQNHPDSVNLLLGTAYLYHVTQHPEQAQELAQRALKEQKNIETLLLNVEVSSGEAKQLALQQLKDFLEDEDDLLIQEKALNLLAKSDPEYALDVINKLLAQKPQAHLLLQLAKVNIRLNKLRNAEIILKDLLLSPAYRTQAHYLLGLIKRKQDFDRQAIPHFYLAQEDSFLVPATEALVSTLLAVNEQNTAFDVFIKARSKAQKPGDRLHLFLLEASLYDQLGNYPEAIATYNKTLVFFPDNTQVLYNRALSHLANNNPAPAIADLESILSRNPDYTPALNALAYHYAEEKTQLVKAGQLIDRALQLVPHQAQYQDTKGWLLFQQGQYAAAQPYIESAYQRLKNPDIASHLIAVLWLQNKQRESIQVWQQASVQFPDNPTLSATLAQLNINPQRLTQEYAQAPVQILPPAPVARPETVELYTASAEIADASAPEFNSELSSEFKPVPTPTSTQYADAQAAGRQSSRIRQPQPYAGKSRISINKVNAAQPEEPPIRPYQNTADTTAQTPKPFVASTPKTQIRPVVTRKTQAKEQTEAPQAKPFAAATASRTQITPMVTRSAQPFASSEPRNTHEPGVKTVIKSMPRQTTDSQTTGVNAAQNKTTQIRIIKNKTATTKIAETKATRKSRITSAADARSKNPTTLPAANPNGDYVIEIVTALDDVASERMVARLAQQLRGINAQRYTRMRGSQRLNIIVLNAYAELGEALRIRDALPRHIGIHEPTVTLKTLVREAANNRLIDIYRSAPQPTPNS